MQRFTFDLIKVKQNVYLSKFTWLLLTRISEFNHFFLFQAVLFGLFALTCAQSISQEPWVYDYKNVKYSYPVSGQHVYGYSPVVPYTHDYQIPSVQNTKYSYWNPVWGHDQWNSQWNYPSQQVYGVKGYGVVSHQQPYVYPVSKVGHVSYQQPHVVGKSWDVVKPYHGQQSYIGQQSYGHQIPQISYY